MHSKLSMKPVDQSSLSEHELKRCHAIAKGQPWQVWEEDILWWSLDRQCWLPVDDSLWQQRRRWLMVETEEGTVPVLIWEVGSGLELPLPPQREPPVIEPAEDLTEVP